MLQFKKILAIDSHEGFRGCFCKMLRENFSACVDEAGTFLEVNNAMQKRVYDFVFLDMGFSDVSSLALTKRISNVMPSAAIIMMSVHNDVEYRMASASSQALYFISKSNFIYDDFVLFLEGMMNKQPKNDYFNHSQSDDYHHRNALT